MVNQSTNVEEKLINPCLRFNLSSYATFSILSQPQGYIFLRNFTIFRIYQINYDLFVIWFQITTIKRITILCPDAVAQARAIFASNSVENLNHVISNVKWALECAIDLDNYNNYDKFNVILYRDCVFK